MINTMYDISNVRLYIDPATTSYVIQIVAGIIIAAGAGLGVFWSKLKRKVTGKSNGKKETEQSVLKELDSGSNKVIRAEDLLDDEEK